MSVRRAGHVGIVGRPNVGKSTLLNRLLGMRLSITASKPQTTRHRILGIHTRGDVQVAYVDTPGLHGERRSALNRVLNRTALAVIEDVDCVLAVVQAPRLLAADRSLLARLADRRHLVVVVNKIDGVAREVVLPLLAEAGAAAPHAEIVPVSARRGDNVERLEQVIEAQLPEQDFLYEAGQLTDRNERFFVAELVREQLTRELGQELPYALSVETERFVEHPGHVEIHVLIWVERESQKGIVVGHQGRTLKKIGTAARHTIAEFLGRGVHLSTWVKVKQGWVDDERALRGLGYDG